MEERIYEGKKIGFYAESVSAWYDFRLEQDKTIITVSIGAVGLIGTIVTTTSVLSANGLWYFGGAGLFFVFCSIAAFISFKFSSDHIETALLDNELFEKKAERRVNIADFISRACMLVALILFFIAVCYVAVERRQDIAQNKKRTPSTSTNELLKTGTGKNTMRSDRTDDHDSERPHFGDTEPPPGPWSGTGGVNRLKPLPPPPKGNPEKSPNKGSDGDQKPPVKK